MDRANLNNMCATLGLSPQAIAGFEQEAYHLMSILVFYRTCSTPEIRTGFIRRIGEIRNEPQTGDNRAARRRYFANHLSQLRGGAFFTVVGTDELARRNSVVSWPWALNDREFAICYQAIRGGNVPGSPNYREPTAAEAAAGSARDAFVTDRVKEAITAAALGLRIVGAVTTRVAFGTTIVGWVVSFGFDFLNAWLQEVTKADMLRRYQIDEQRRLHAVSLGLSRYRRI